MTKSNMVGKNMRIETDNLVIRSLEHGDELVFADMAKDGSLLDVGFPADCSEWIGGWIEEAIKLSEENDPRKFYLAYTVCLKSTNQIIGTVGCSFYDDLDEVGITYFIGSAFRGSGYAAESVKAYCDYFFSNYEEHRIIASIREANISSWKTVEKCSFELIGKKMYKDIADTEPVLYRFYKLLK